MKKMLCCAALLAHCIYGYSQNPFKRDPETQSQMRNQMISSLFREGASQYPGKPTALQQRLIGIKHDSNWQPGLPSLDDTSSVYYSGERGSRFNYNLLRYDLQVYDNYQPLAYRLWVMPVGFADVAADSVLYASQNDGYHNRSIMKYNSNGVMDTLLYLPSNSTGSLTALAFNTANKITAVKYVDSTVTALRKLSYSPGLARVIGDTTFYGIVSSNYHAWEYTYYPDDALKTLEGTWSNTSAGSGKGAKFTFTYTPYHQIETVTQYYWSDDLDMYERSSFDSFTYDGNNPLFKERYVVLSGEDAYLETRQFNAGGLPDTIYLYFADNSQAGALSLMEYTTMVYNEFQNPVTRKTYTAGVTQPYEVFRYYYQNYETSVTELSEDQRQLSIYPNPVGNRFTLAWPGKEPVKQAVVSIVNMDGKVMRRMNTSLKSGNNVYDASGIAPGNYLLIVAGNRGKRLAKPFVKH